MLSKIKYYQKLSIIILNFFRYSTGPYGGIIAVPISCTNDGMGPTLHSPPPYGLNIGERVQPGAPPPTRALPDASNNFKSAYAPPLVTNPVPTGAHCRPLSPKPLSPKPPENNSFYR